jgi:predicted transcriptional regulator
MKATLLLVFLFFAASCIQAASVEQIAKLGELKTKDELILQLVQKEGLDRPLTMDDVIMLREKGVSERVIEYLLNLTPPEKTIAAKQEGESVYISKNLRAYQTRDKKGKPITMVTNLDESGKRMGPPPPPNPEPEVVREAEQPREVYVTVRHEEPERYTEDEFIEDPYYEPGIPLYPEYGGYPYYPYYPVAPIHRGHSGKGHYRFDKPWGNPPARNSQGQTRHSQGQTRTPVNTMRPGSARTNSRSK